MEYPVDWLWELESMLKVDNIKDITERFGVPMPFFSNREIENQHWKSVYQLFLDYTVKGGGYGILAKSNWQHITAISLYIKDCEDITIDDYCYLAGNMTPNTLKLVELKIKDFTNLYYDKAINLSIELGNNDNIKYIFSHTTPPINIDHILTYYKKYYGTKYKYGRYKSYSLMRDERFIFNLLIDSLVNVNIIRLIKECVKNEDIITLKLLQEKKNINIEINESFYKYMVNNIKLVEFFVPYMKNMESIKGLLNTRDNNIIKLLKENKLGEYKDTNSEDDTDPELSPYFSDFDLGFLSGILDIGNIKSYKPKNNTLFRVFNAMPYDSSGNRVLYLGNISDTKMKQYITNYKIMETEINIGNGIILKLQETSVKEGTAKFFMITLIAKNN